MNQARALGVMGAQPRFDARFICQLKVKCACGTKVAVGFTEGRPTVMHELPTCETFNSYVSCADYIEFLNDLELN